MKEIKLPTDYQSLFTYLDTLDGLMNIIVEKHGMKQLIDILIIWKHI